MTSDTWSWLALGLAVALLSGCESYRLRGAVVEGTIPGVWVVSQDDPRLAQTAAGGGIPGATLEFTIDPASIRPRKLPATVSDDAGRFELPVDQGGAGFLEYELGVLCRGTGYRAVWQLIDMPASRKRLLIVMTPGRDTYQSPTDLTQETLEMGKKLQGK